MCGIVGFTGRENAVPILLKGLYSLEYRGYDSAGIAVTVFLIFRRTFNMCGIVGFTGRENAVPILLKGLYSLEYRGYDSAGIATFTAEGLKVVKSRGRIAALEEKIHADGGLSAVCGIGHTRWATHGEPSDRNSHPHLGGDSGRIAVVHNGIIENYLELRSRLEKHGYVFQSETDTETVAHLLDYLHTGKHEDLAMTVLKAVTMLRGSYALGVVSNRSGKRREHDCVRYHSHYLPYSKVHHSG